MKTLAQVEKAYILKIVKESETRIKAARILGICQRTLRNKLKKYGVPNVLDRSQFSPQVPERLRHLEDIEDKIESQYKQTPSE
jgi:hypothetical protein